ncbi:hypothetical protein B0A50_05935 [Salinomyces thailandicus]|uniref:DUF952 domain-containing protein n=1 Tax=Salinomyces thailandicus TaxID=706561 RepID=A0A4U0TSY2_9PEZI|nr:hypothetical protein B0A50_05935 [Salinomyces thailandica]
MSPPEYLYKILDAPPPSPLPTTLPATELDTQDGFIHLSTAKQTPITAKLFFSNCETLWVLKLRREALDGEIEYSTDPNAGVSDGCAHVHGSRSGLGSGNVEGTVEARRQNGQTWVENESLRGLVASSNAD